LWFAFKFFDIFGFLQLLNQEAEIAVVVICFQILWYLWFFTTASCAVGSVQPLWFAFKFFDIFGFLQPTKSKLTTKLRCDLLSNSLISLVFYNRVSFYYNKEAVVICFQILWYLWFFTTNTLQNMFLAWLWFAFKFFDIFGFLQLYFSRIRYHPCCDLLSNSLISLVFYNENGVRVCELSLWFAFKFFDIFGFLQRKAFQTSQQRSCDLLSNSLISLVFYNWLYFSIHAHLVVICFQILWYLWFFTTIAPDELKEALLWFAFKFFDIFGFLQPSLFSLANCTVVICFQILWYLWFFTTFMCYFHFKGMLWFAFKFFDIFGFLQLFSLYLYHKFVVICFQILWYLWFFTTCVMWLESDAQLWFAFKFFDIFGFLQLDAAAADDAISCDLLSNSLISLVFYNLHWQP
jgi:hypothetical protein